MQRRARWRAMDVDVPFELVGEVAGARAVAEAGHVEGGAASARHGGAVFSRVRVQRGALDETGGAVERVVGRGGGGDGDGDGDGDGMARRRLTDGRQRGAKALTLGELG
jgi:hypothetical protein